MTELERLLNLGRAQFLSDPESALAFISAHQPNVCRPARTSLVTTLGPGANTTITQGVLQGFVFVITRLGFYTDVPFAITAALSRDENLWFVDPGLVPATIPFLDWVEAAYRWSAAYTNTSAVIVNLHTVVSGYQVENTTLRNTKAALGPLSWSMAEYGTPEYAGPVIGWKLAEK